MAAQTCRHSQQQVQVWGGVGVFALYTHCLLYTHHHRVYCIHTTTELIIHADVDEESVGTHDDDEPQVSGQGSDDRDGDGAHQGGAAQQRARKRYVTGW